MIRLLSALIALAGANAASAHFSFIVPQPNTPTAKLILSEDLNPDTDVDITILRNAKLFARDAAGRSTPLTATRSVNAYDLAFDPATRVLHGTADLGWTQRGKAPPHVLVYHPKTILGDAFDPKHTLGTAPVEIVPTGKPGDLRFQVLTHGKPAAGVQVVVIQPNGKETRIDTESDGRTPALDLQGRYGAWTRYFDNTPGERDGKKYEQVRHYAMLIANVGTPDKTAAATAQPAAYARMPEPTSSFGAVAANGWLYVYGGHIARTHTYHTTAVSGRFHRLNLADGKTWEDLPAGPALQGMNLATHNGKVYRVGGMQPRNKEGDKADNYSVPDVARFDPATRQWESLPPLPEPRSSHDVAVVGGTLFVIGGWNMKGRAAGNDWLGTALSLDLSDKNAQWKTIKQPFERRALIVAVHDRKIYVIGGFDEESEPIQKVDIYDTTTHTWTTGPALPGKQMHGFAPAACTLDGRLYVSVGDGTMYRLNPAGDSWQPVARTTPRIVHRLVPDGQRILVVGGAARGDNFDLIEAVDVTN